MIRPLRYKDFTACGQIFYLLCALVIFSYILFDLLDLDGSDFTKIFNSSHRTLIGAFVPAEAEFDFNGERDALTFGTILIATVLIGECATLGRISRLDSALLRSRAHGSLLAFARNSLPVAVPDH
jgi:hypothetical protein